MTSRIIAAAALAALFLPVQAFSQVVREDEQMSIAGVIGGAHASEAFWTLKSVGGEIVFASLDAELYATRDHQHEVVLAAAPEDGGGCQDEGGPALFCLQIIDQSSTVLCQSTRPAPPPGWQRDPRFACLLPVTATQRTYTVRVSAALEGACTVPSTAVGTPTGRPFLLNISIRGIAPSGVSIQQATAASKSRF